MKLQKHHKNSRYVTKYFRNLIMKIMQNLTSISQNITQNNNLAITSEKFGRNHKYHNSKTR